MNQTSHAAKPVSSIEAYRAEEKFVVWAASW